MYDVVKKPPTELHGVTTPKQVRTSEISLCDVVNRELTAGFWFQLQPVQSMQISATMNGYNQTLTTAGLGKEQDD